MDKIKAILLDIDNTILDFNKSAEKAIEIAFKKFGLDFNNNTINVFIEQNDMLWHRIEKGELTRQELHKIRFNTIFKALGTSGDGEKVETEFRNALYNIAEPVDGAQELVKYLSSKYKVYSASNAIYNQQINRLKKSGMHKYFSDFFVSEIIGYQKPSKEFFDYCFTKLKDVKIDQTIMIGDSLTADIFGAKNYGIKCVWFNRDKKQIDTEFAPDYTIEKLEQIKNIL